MITENKPASMVWRLNKKLGKPDSPNPGAFRERAYRQREHKRPTSPLNRSAGRVMTEVKIRLPKGRTGSD